MTYRIKNVYLMSYSLLTCLSHCLSFSAFMPIGVKHGVTVGEVEKNHKDEVRG